MKKLLLFLPIFSFASMELPYGKLDITGKLEHKSHSKNWSSNEKIENSSVTGDFRYSSKSLWGFNLTSTLHLNAPVSTYPETNGGYFGLNQVDKKGEGEVGGYLGEVSLNYKGETLDLKTYHHYINTPFIKSDDKDQLKTTIEGITATYKVDEELKFSLGVYSRIFGVGNSIATERGEFSTFSSVLSGGVNINDNYLGMFGVDLQDSEKRYGGKFYYYSLLEYDVSPMEKNSLSLFYMDTIYAMKIKNDNKVRRGNKIVSTVDTDNIIILGQFYQGSEDIKNDFSVLGVKSIYRNSKSSVGYFVSLNVVSGENGGVRYPFATVPEYSKTGGFDLSYLNSGEFSYKLEGKYYKGRNNLNIYYGGFSGEDFGVSGIKNASVYGVGADLRFFDKKFFLNAYVENQELEGVKGSALEDNLAVNLQMKYLF